MLSLASSVYSFKQFCALSLTCCLLFYLSQTKMTTHIQINQIHIGHSKLSFNTNQEERPPYRAYKVPNLQHTPLTTKNCLHWNCLHSTPALQMLSKVNNTVIYFVNRLCIHMHTDTKSAEAMSSHSMLLNQLFSNNQLCSSHVLYESDM